MGIFLDISLIIEEGDLFTFSRAGSSSLSLSPLHSQHIDLGLQSLLLRGAKPQNFQMVDVEKTGFGDDWLYVPDGPTRSAH